MKKLTKREKARILKMLNRKFWKLALAAERSRPTSFSMFEGLSRDAMAFERVAFLLRNQWGIK